MGKKENLYLLLVGMLPSRGVGVRDGRDSSRAERARPQGAFPIGFPEVFHIILNGYVIGFSSIFNSI